MRLENPQEYLALTIYILSSYPPNATISRIETIRLNILTKFSIISF